MEEESDEEEKVNKNILEILELERKAEESFYQNEPEKAANYVQKIIDSYCANDEAENIKKNKKRIKQSYETRDA